jgi:hypothetical protein
VITYRGTPLDFILGGIAVIATSPLWAKMFSYIMAYIYPLLFAEEITRTGHRKWTLTFTISTAGVGLSLALIGLFRLAHIL